jgi:hypothetical protein
MPRNWHSCARPVIVGQVETKIFRCAVLTSGFVYTNDAMLQQNNTMRRYVLHGGVRMHTRRTKPDLMSLGILPHEKKTTYISVIYV